MQDGFSGFSKHKVCQIKIVAENFYVSVSWSYIKVAHDKLISDSCLSSLDGHEYWFYLDRKNSKVTI